MTSHYSSTIDLEAERSETESQLSFYSGTTMPYIPNEPPLEPYQPPSTPERYHLADLPFRSPTPPRRRARTVFPDLEFRKVFKETSKDIAKLEKKIEKLEKFLKKKKRILDLIVKLA